jgi:hypothetical protein
MIWRRFTLLSLAFGRRGRGYKMVLLYLLGQRRRYCFLLPFLRDVVVVIHLVVVVVTLLLLFITSSLSLISNFRLALATEEARNQENATITDQKEKKLKFASLADKNLPHSRIKIYLTRG